MEEPKEKIYSLLQKVAEEMGASDVSFLVEKPKDASHGDFSANIALVLFRGLAVNSAEVDTKIFSLPAQDYKKSNLKFEGSNESSENFVSPRATSPLELAKKIVDILNTKYKILDTDFDKVKVAAPGFINFYLSQKYLQDQVQSIIEMGDSYGSVNIGKGRKASVEFVSANPTGPLHIGNARGGPIGDSLANVFSKAGYEVVREYWHNDVGGQVDRLGETIYFEIHPDQKPESYEAQYLGSYIKELAQTVKEQMEESQDELTQEQFIDKAGKIAVELMLTEILKDCEAMGIKYDILSKESDFLKKVPAVLSRIKKFIKEKDGAEWFAPADEFLKDRETVVKKSDGEFTYFSTDIALHDEKFERVGTSGLVIDIWGANHSGHVPRMKAVVRALGFNPDMLRVVLYQYVRLKRGTEVVNMSKRAGNFVTAREVLDEVGKDAFRFFLLTPRSQTHMDFDLELAKKKASENPVFYVQYANSRISSIFSKLKIKNFKFQIDNADLSLLKTQEEIELIRHLLKLPYLIEESVKTLEVNPLTTYALEIANLFHKFYEKQMVISSDEKLTQARLALLKATQITLKNTLGLLGVSAPEHM